MGKPNTIIEQKEFDKLVGIIKVEIEQSQVRLVVAANIQLLLHYWKVGMLFHITSNSWDGVEKLLKRFQKPLKWSIQRKKDTLLVT